jgi:hypothetical protein
MTPAEARGLAGYRGHRRNRITGDLVIVYHAAEAGLDSDDGRAPYSTVCDRHGEIISHETLKLALGHAGDPSGWCSACAWAVRGEIGDPWRPGISRPATWADFQPGGVAATETSNPPTLQEIARWWGDVYLWRTVLLNRREGDAYDVNPGGRVPRSTVRSRFPGIKLEDEASLTWAIIDEAERRGFQDALREFKRSQTRRKVRAIAERPAEIGPADSRLWP